MGQSGCVTCQNRVANKLLADKIFKPLCIGSLQGAVIVCVKCVCVYVFVLHIHIKYRHADILKHSVKRIVAKWTS